MKKDEDIIAFLLGLILIFSAVLLFTIINHGDFKKTAIKLGHAEYNQFTGEWQWKTNLVSTNR